MNNMTKLNLLHDLANTTDSRPLGVMTPRCEEVECELACWVTSLGDDAYLSMPLPEKLTLAELRWVSKVLKA